MPKEYCDCVPRGTPSRHGAGVMVADGWMVLPGTLLAGAGLLTANATPTTRGRSKRRQAAREELQEWRAAETRRGRKPAVWRNEAMAPTGQVLQLSCGVTPNAAHEARRPLHQPRSATTLFPASARCAC